jgi:hypothetical protein
MQQAPSPFDAAPGSVVGLENAARHTAEQRLQNVDPGFMLGHAHTMSKATNQQLLAAAARAQKIAGAMKHLRKLRPAAHAQHGGLDV